MSHDDAVTRGNGHADHELIDGLEPDQTVATSSRPFGRYRASHAMTVALWTVRLFVLLISTMVVYTFIVSVPR
jgi:hypothetical protein